MTRIYMNRTRSKHLFPVWAESKSKSKSRPTFVRQRQKTLVLGDSADAAIPDAQRTPRCPSPKLTVTEEQWKAIGPRGQKRLNALVAKGDVDLQTIN